MSHPPNKMPTDAKIVRALKGFEESWTVLFAAIRNGDGDDRKSKEDAMYDTLEMVRTEALRAQRRIDQKKEMSDEI